PGYQTGGQQPVGANTDLSSVQAAVGQPARAKWPFGVAALGVLALGTAAVGVVMVQGARATPEPPSAAASNATPPEPDLLAATSGAVPAPEPAPELSQKGEAAPSAEPRA